MRFPSSSSPVVNAGLGVLLLAACCVGLALFWGDSVAAVEYQWGLAGYREAPAQVVETFTTHSPRSGPRPQVVLSVDGTRETIHIHDGELFGKLAPGEPVRERLVTDRVVAIRVGAQELQIEDNLNWLIGLLGGVLVGALLLVTGIRTGLAKAFSSRRAIGSFNGSTSISLEVVLLVASGVLFFSAFSIGAIEGVTQGVPTWPVVVSVIFVFTVMGGVLLIRAKRTNQALAGITSLSSSGELVTALIVSAKNGGWDVSFIGDGRAPKDLTVSALDEAALRRIETLIADTSKSRPVDVSVAWYPWESKGGRGPRDEFMVFMTEHKNGEYVATLDGRPEVTASSPTFAGLSSAIETVMAGQGAADPQHLQACITWNRTLTARGYVHAGPAQ